jgi:stalled ribosome rescue protein Dom34
MKTSKQLGIWMDHAHAHLSIHTPQPILTTTIASKFTHQSEGITLEKSEKGMHNKEQHQQAEYYKSIAEHIRNFDDVILFGPTDAKVELLHLLRADHKFDHITIESKQADKMTENQQHAFVNEYFLSR